MCRIFTLFEFYWVMHAGVVQLLAYWRGQVGSRSVLEVWRIAPLYLMWNIRREKRRKSLRTFWSNGFLVGLGHIITLNPLTFLNLWTFVLLLACKGGLSMYRSCVLGLCPSTLFNAMSYL